MSEAEKIAAGLTEAQRALLLDLPTKASASYAPRIALLRDGLAIIVRPPDGKLHATPLGLEVRKLLEQSDA
jgi:hypothetical protein